MEAPATHKKCPIRGTIGALNRKIQVAAMQTRIAVARTRWMRTRPGQMEDDADDSYRVLALQSGRGDVKDAAGGRCGDESAHPANHGSGAGTGARTAHRRQEEGCDKYCEAHKSDDPAFHAINL